MKIGALVLGVIGGLIALAYGVLGYGLGSLADTAEAGAGSGMKIVSIGVPIFALIPVLVDQPWSIMSIGTRDWAHRF